MGRKALLMVVCWLTLGQTFGDKRTQSSSVQDNVSAESAPRLYRNVPHGVYASAAPYAAYSFHLPTFAAAPRTAATQIVPVKQHFVNHLTDSYGNKFVGTPPLSTYKIALPQQFVSLQTKLPEHLTQPLVAASANFQFKQANGQFFGAPYRVPVLQGPTPTPLGQFPNFGQIYGDQVKHLAPSSVIHNHGFGFPNTQQQSTNNKAVFTTNHKTEPKFFQQKEPQIIIGKPKLQDIKEASHKPHGETKHQRVQEAHHSSHEQHHHEPKYQSNQEAAHTSFADVKYQRIQETPQFHHGEHKLEQQAPHPTQGEEKHQREQDVPHYESKFQIIQEQPHSGQFQRIKEYHAPHGEVKFQRVQEAPPTAQTQHTYEKSHVKQQHTRHGENSQLSHKNNGKLQAAPAKQTITYINDINGEKTIVELDTKPTLPLLDLTLLEPLTFDNPLVPQVQHFLPRINQATYQKLPELNIPAVTKYQKDYAVQKTMSYDSGDETQQKIASKKKNKKPTQQTKYAKKSDVPKKTTVTYHETLDDAPEVTYEITNSPNYKETIKQKAVSYNKQTQSEPVSYTYGSQSEKEPVTYSYSRKSKVPEQIKNVEYSGNGPSHLIYNFQPGVHLHEEKSHNSAPHHSEAANENESSHESDDDGSSYRNHQPHTEQHKENPQSLEEHHESPRSEKEHYYEENEKYHENNDEKQQAVVHESPPKYHSEPVQFTSDNINFQPILKEYENNIRMLTVPSASIKVDPHQHVQVKSTPPPHINHHEEHSHSQTPHQRPHSLSTHQEHHHSSPKPQQHYHQSSVSTPRSESYNGPASHIHEKSKRIIIHEEAPDEMHMLTERMREEVIKREENDEEDFEKAYKDAAFGFPAYNQMSKDAEKDIFDPESYGVPRDHVEFDLENTPFQQYQEEGDNFPKESRSGYKDARDKMKQNYYTDYSISKPESLLDRYQNKLGYYKLFKQQKPTYLADDDDEKEKQKSAKFTAAPSYEFHSERDNANSYYGNPKPKQQLYEYDYSKGTSRDNSAFASRPYKNYKSRTSFVEPQFQYGFEPLPRLLDSELAAMASNDSPESEKPGMRKKIYKEYGYIKKTSTSGGAPAS